MDQAAIAKLLAQFLPVIIGALPALLNEVQSAATEHWTKDHVTQLKLGLNHLVNVVDAVDVAHQEQLASAAKAS